VTEAAFGVYMITLALICVSVYGCFRGIAWVIQHGWRSMLGLVALRGEAVLTVAEELSCGCARDGRPEYFCMTCRHSRCPQHRDVPHVCDREVADWDVHVDTALDVLLTHEATPDVDEFGEPERWVALEEEFADLDPLAAKLGERAS